jgi:hypothetical protein
MTTLRDAAQQFVSDYENGDLGDLKHYARAIRAALAQQGCTYTVKEMDGFGTLWATECGEELYVAAPEAIGFSLAPMPNANGKFCRFCGNKITLKGKK